MTKVKRAVWCVLLGILSFEAVKVLVGLGVRSKIFGEVLDFLSLPGYITANLVCPAGPHSASFWGEAFFGGFVTFYTCFWALMLWLLQASLRGLRGHRNQ